MYFSQFPSLIYDINNQGNQKLVTDIFKRVKVRDKVVNETSLYEFYYVPNGEKPEDTAFKHFGNPELHWIILMTNNIVDRYFEWPLSDADFERFVNDKYANADATHHHEITRSSGKTTGDGPDDFSHKIEVNSTDADAQSVSNYEYEQRLQDQKRQIKLLDKAYLNVFIEEFERLVQR